MATITITIPDDDIQTVIDSLCTVYGYNPAGGTKAAFARRQVKLFLQRTVRDARRIAAVQSAIAAAQAEADGINISVS